MNIRKIIKEELLKEVGGYDDGRIMAQHAGKNMYDLAETHRQLTVVLSVLANAVMDGQNKNDIKQYLKEVSEEIDVFIPIIKTAISEVMEDDVILQSKKVISSLKTFKRKIDVLYNFSDAMGDNEQFIERVKLLLMDLIPSTQEYGKQLNLTNRMFGDRLGAAGNQGFSSN